MENTRCELKGRTVNAEKYGTRLGPTPLFLQLLTVKLVGLVASASVDFAALIDAPDDAARQ